MKVRKGDFGYFKKEKKRRLMVTLGLFAVPLLIFFSGILYFKTRMNLMTIVAVVGCLPACKSAVGMVMAFMQKSMDEETYRRIKEAAKDLTMSYEMYLTSYDKSGYVDAFAICGNEVVGYSSHSKTDAKYMGNHVQKILRQNGYGVNVKILKELNPYLERLNSMNEHREALEKDISFTPDERYPDLSRAELIKHTILAISL
ncbi:MAG: hypothetical protein ACOYBE_06170 [Blautia sp.]|jgi:hypothetical protein